MKEIRGIRSLPKGTTYDEMNSPVGKLTIITSVEGLHSILWDVDRSLKYEKIISGLIKSKNKKTVDRIFSKQKKNI